MTSHNHSHEDGHDHQHSHSRRFYQTKTFRLIAMLSLTLSYFVVELVVGNITKSVALIADAFHMLSDVISLIIGIVAVRFAKRRSTTNTYGWVRAEVVGANINTVFLLALCLTIIFDVIKRFIEPEPIENVTLLLIVGSIGLGINIIGLFLFQGFHGHSHGGGGGTAKAADPPENNNRFERHSARALQEVIADQVVTVEIEEAKGEPKKKKTASMNMHGVFLHVLADALGSVVVIISALIIKFVPHDPNDVKHWTVYIDPSLSVIIVIIISISSFRLFRDTAAILLQTIPKHLHVETIQHDLLRSVPEISSIHELHIWRLTDEKVIASAHLHRRTLENYMSVAEKVKQFFHSIGIHSVTIQYEHEEETATLVGDCLLRCENNTCETQTCCTVDSVRSNARLSILPKNVFENPVAEQVSEQF